MSSLDDDWVLEELIKDALKDGLESEFRRLEERLLDAIRRELHDHDAAQPPSIASSRPSRARTVPESARMRAPNPAAKEDAQKLLSASGDDDIVSVAVPRDLADQEERQIGRGGFKRGFLPLMGAKETKVFKFFENEMSAFKSLKPSSLRGEIDQKVALAQGFFKMPQVAVKMAFKGGSEPARGCAPPPGRPRPSLHTAAVAESEFEVVEAPIHEPPALPGVPDSVVESVSACSFECTPSRIQQSKSHGFAAVDNAMGFIPNKAQAHHDDRTSRARTFALRLIQSERFELLSLAVIFGSTVLVGLSTEDMVGNRRLKPHPTLHALDVCFLSFFIVELSLRLAAYRIRYFTMYGWIWNWVDALLVFCQVVEELTVLVETKSSVSNALSLTVMLRVVRVFRVLRVVRIFHVMRFASELRLLITCIAYSSKSFAWSVIFVFLIIYVIAVYLTQLAWEHEINTGMAGEMRQLFGSVPRSVLSLFAALTGGGDWMDTMLSLTDEISPYLGVLYVLWIAFMLFAVMNVVTATFVEQAIDRANQVKELNRLSQAMCLFNIVNTDGDGCITFKELEEKLGTPVVRDFFESIDVAVCEAQWLFDILDYDNSGSINFAEFLIGCIRLQGPARAIDLVMVTRELKDTLEKR